MNKTPFVFDISSYSFMLFLASTVCAVVTGAAYLLLPPQIPLWLSLALPEQQLAPKFFIWLFPSSMYVVSFATSISVATYKEIDTNTKRIIWSGSILAIFVLYLAFVKLIVAAI